MEINLKLIPFIKKVIIKSKFKMFNDLVQGIEQ